MDLPPRTPDIPFYQGMSTTWVNAVLKQPCAWGAASLPCGFTPKATQPFLDMVTDWPATFHFTTRAGGVKQNDRLWGDYHATPVDQAGNPIPQTWTPALHLDHAGLQVAGWHMPITWVDPWQCQWRNANQQHAHERWLDGDVQFTSDRNIAHAQVRNRQGEQELWRLERTRFVGGPGALSIFSPRRAIPCGATEFRLKPTPTNNRMDFSRALPQIPVPLATRLTCPGWDYVFRGDRYAKYVPYSLVCDRGMEGRDVPACSQHLGGFQ